MADLPGCPERWPRCCTCRLPSPDATRADRGADYVGEDVEAASIRAADYDVKRAETGIVSTESTQDRRKVREPCYCGVSGEGVQQALLKSWRGALSQASVLPRVVAPSRVHQIDQRLLFIVAGGDSPELEKIITRSASASGASLWHEFIQRPNLAPADHFAGVMPEDLIKFSLIDHRQRRGECLGLAWTGSRWSDPVEPSSFVQAFIRLFEMDGVELEFTDVRWKRRRPRRSIPRHRCRGPRRSWKRICR